MWFLRRSFGTRARCTAPLPATTLLRTPARHCSSLTSSPPLHAATATQPTSISLPYTCRLLDSICDANQANTVKRRRVHGAVRKMERDIVDSFATACASLPPAEKRAFMLQWLQSLAASVEYLPRHESAYADGTQEADRFSSRSPRRSRSSASGREEQAWSGASPFFTVQTSDVLCLCLRECVMSDGQPSPDTLRELLRCAVALELGDIEVLQHLVHSLTKADPHCRQAPSEAVQLLHCISLAVKRCKLPPPSLDRLLSVLPGATLNSRESLLVLCAIHRIPTVHAGDVVGSVSRKAAAGVATYNVKDTVYGLEVCALLPGINEAYAAAVLNRACVLAPSFTPRQLGSVCKYVAMLNPTRRENTLAYSCGAELRRLLPLLVDRAEQLLGRFHLRDSRNVLRCFREHKVRHSLIFARLTPLAEDN